MQVAPTASTYAPAPGDLVSQTPAGSAHLFADPYQNPYQDPQQDPTGAFADSSPGGSGDTGSQAQPDPYADTALASTSLFAPTDHTPSGTLAQMVQAQTKPLLITAENAAGLGIDFAHTKPLTVTPENAPGLGIDLAHTKPLTVTPENAPGLGIDLAHTKPLTVTPENAAGLNLPPQTGSAAPASATAPNASPTEIAALELLLAEPANQEIIAQFGPPLRPLNTDTDVGQGILARFGPDLGARLTQLQEAHNAVRDEFLQALDHAQQNPGPDVAGSEFIARHENWRDGDVTEKTLYTVTHPPSASQASDLQAIDEKVKFGFMERADHSWRLSDPAEFAKAYAAGDSPAQKAFAQLHGQAPLQLHEAVEQNGGDSITPAYYTLGDIQLVRGGPTVTENGNPGPWAPSTWQSPQLSPERSADLINKEYLWFDPTNGWSTSPDNIKQSTSFLDKALPLVFAGVMTFATAGAFGITAASASTSLGQSMALGAIGSATMQLTTGGKIDLGDLLRSALTAGVTFGVTNLTGLGTALQSADLATRSLGHLGKAGLQGLLQEATGGQFKDGLTNSLLASVAGEVGKSLDSHIAALSKNGELSVQEASMLKLLSRAASSAVKVVGSNDPAAGFASDFLGEVLGEELRGAQAKEPSQSQDPSQNPSQTANGAGDKPSSDWVRNLGPSGVDAQGLGLRPGLAGQGLRISGDALSNWSDEIDGAIALNGSMAPGAQAITEAVVGQGQGPLAALAAAGLDRQQQIAAYGQLVASGQVKLNAQGVPIVQPGQVLQFDLSDMSAAQLGGRAIAQESAGRAQRQAREATARNPNPYVLSDGEVADVSRWMNSPISNSESTSQLRWGSSGSNIVSNADLVALTGQLSSGPRNGNIVQQAWNSDNTQSVLNSRPQGLLLNGLIGQVGDAWAGLTGYNPVNNTYYGPIDQQGAMWRTVAGSILAVVPEAMAASRVSSGLDALGAHWGSRIESLAADDVRFSQNTVSYNKVDRKSGEKYTYDDLVQSMKTGGWKGDPVDVVKMPDGAFTSMDNTRISAARDAGINVQANVRGFNDPLPADMIANRRFGDAKTWGEALTGRISNQKPPSFGNANPNGSPTPPKVTGRP